MGLTTLPEVGTSGALGPTKRNRALRPTADANVDIDADEWNAAMVALQQVCAAVGLADGSTTGSLVAKLRTTVESTAIEEDADTGDLTHDVHYSIDASSGEVEITVSAGTTGDEMSFFVVDATNDVSFVEDGTTIYVTPTDEDLSAVAVLSLVSLFWTSASVVLVSVTPFAELTP